LSSYTLHLHSDRLEPRAETRLPGCHRVIYVRDGDAIMRAGAQAAGFAANSAWYGRDTVTVTAGAAGAMLLRWELVASGEARGGHGAGQAAGHGPRRRLAGTHPGPWPM